MEYINIWRNGKHIDTTHRILNSKIFNDSIYTLNYSEAISPGDTITKNYELPISNSIRTFQHLKDTSNLRLRYIGYDHYIYDRKRYSVYKYQLDDPEADDEGMEYFFVPEFGIVIQRSTTWGSYGRLNSNSNPNDRNIIFYLVEKIILNMDCF
ncbi:MAG: hypothetical protein HC880_19620 [Bacteroidia bacterium]|nr:hypothetical protein [Bacteroidia bacterium]